MNLDPARTALGCVGVATEGKVEGRFVYAYPELEAGYWVACLEGRPADFEIPGFRLSGENPGLRTGILETLVCAWGVVWVLGEAEAVIERRVFDVRATLQVEPTPGLPAWWEAK